MADNEWDIGIAERYAAAVCPTTVIPMLLRFTTRTATYAAGSEVIRVGRRSKALLAAQQMLDLSRVFNAHGARSAIGIDVVYPAPDIEVSRWERIPQPDTTEFPAYQLGQLVRRLHTIPVEEIEAAIGPVPNLVDTIPKITERLHILATDGTYGTDVEVLSSTWDRLAPQITACVTDQPGVITHSDLHVDNVLVDSHGPALCDLESVIVAPWEWDHAAIHNDVRLFDADPGTVDDYTAGYAADPTTSPWWPVLRDWKAFSSLTWCAVEGTRSEPYRIETLRRLRTWPDHPSSWRAL